MIIVKLMGGLGNQMFQYATARRLAHVSSVPLRLDLSWFGRRMEGTTPRDYALGPFNVVEDPAQLSGPGRAAGSLLGRLPLLGGRFSTIGGAYLKEKHFHFDPSLLEPRRRAYLDGYWQSERYFRDIREILLREFSLKDSPRGVNRGLAGEIAGRPGSVSLHVRRGDYANNPEVMSFHGTCTPGYYAAAINRIAAELPDPHFFIFSDDPAWVAEHLVTGHPHTIVAHNGPDAAHEDLHLMSLCSHHIIANSTFSWWGAWLCANPGKIVIAPRRWFATDKLDARDLVPASWVRI